MKISEISLYFNGLRFHLSILPKSNYLPLCCFTGISYIDMCLLSNEHLSLAEDGVWWIKSARKKSGVDFEIPLMELPLRILKKYRDIAPEGKLLPMYSNCVLNYHLKHIAEICGIKRKLVFHAAKHNQFSI